MLQCSFSFAAAQLLVQNDFRTAEKPMLQCSFCSAAFRKLQRNFRFRLWHVAGRGLEGWGSSVFQVLLTLSSKRQKHPFFP